MEEQLVKTLFPKVVNLLPFINVGKLISNIFIMIIDEISKENISERWRNELIVSVTKRLIDTLAETNVMKRGEADEIISSLDVLGHSLIRLYFRYDERPDNDHNKCCSNW